MIDKEIKKLAARYYEDVVKIRRELHKYPELSFNEEKTSGVIQRQLEKLNIAFTTGWAGHGVVAIIQGNGKGKGVIGLRADMDALPIQEANKVAYRSKNQGIMHACGHDVHTSSLLGVAMILSRLKDKFGGTVKLIFQPGEEKLPGGASIMIKEGVLSNPSPQIMIGQHVHPPLEVGKVGFCAGKYMASADEIYITVDGRGGHAALPQDVIDPIAISAQLITALQQVVSREANPIIPTVLSFGKIFSDGGATNVIPDCVHIHGTFRTMDEKWRKEAHHILKREVRLLCSAFGAKGNIDVKVGYPCLHNDIAISENSFVLAQKFLGKRNVVKLPIRLTSEDFAFYSQKRPSCFYRLGTGNKKRGLTSPVHTNTFDIDEDALITGMGLMSFLAVSNLNI